MKNLTLLFLITLLFSCKKEESVSPISSDQIVGTWQMNTSRVILKANVNGKEETADQTRNGTSADILIVTDNGTISDPSDLFGTNTYAWKYSINGNELKLSKNSLDLAYFTISTTASGMQWKMNTEQLKRSLTETTGNNSVLNGDSSAKDFIISNDLTIDFIKK